MAQSETPARPCRLWPSDDDDDHDHENGNADDDKNGNADDDDDDFGDRDGIPSGPEPVRRTSRRPFKAESSHASQYYLSQVYDDRAHED